MRIYRLEFDQDGDHRVVRISEGEKITMGRALACDVVVAHGLVSGTHAEARVDPSGLILEDLDSKNGTWVDRTRIETPKCLGHGDAFTLGPVKVRVKLEGQGGETTVTIREGSADDTQIVTSIDTEKSLIEDTGSRADTFRALAMANRSLAVIHKVGTILLTATNEDDLCQSLLDLLFDVLPADRACLILSGVEGSLDIRAARSRGEPGEIVVSRTIIEETIGKGMSLLTSDAGSDDRFSNGQSVLLEGIQAAMCAPLRGKSRILGALYVDTQIETGVFRQEDLELLTTLGIQGGVAIENLRLARKNLQAERLAAIGGVMAGLSHDIRNILVALRSGAFLMDEIIAETKMDNLGEAWELVRNGTDTISRLVEDMVSYSKVRETELDLTDISLLVSQVCDRFLGTAEEQGAVLTTDLADDLGEVPLDVTGIDRVLSNLIVNALDAVGEEGGRVAVRTFAPDPDHVGIMVTDNGAGIDPEHRERIFDLLFSTKGSKGTGFGLAISLKIVNEHGGAITMSSEPGEGAECRVILPRA